MGLLSLVPRSVSGEISYSKARAITRVHDPRLERLLLQYAEQGTGEQLQRIVSEFTSSVRRIREAEDPVPAWDRASVTSTLLDHELTEVRLVLPTPEAQDALARLDARARRVRREAVRAAKAAGEEPVVAGLGVERTEAFLAAVDLLDEGEPGDISGGDRTTLVIHADAEQLTAPEPGEDRIEVVETVSGSRRRRLSMSARTLRRLACDARYAVIGHDPDGDTAGVSGSTRRIPSRLRRALLARDRTCRFPGCHRAGGLHGHHILPVEDGGPPCCPT